MVKMEITHAGQSPTHVDHCKVNTSTGHSGLKTRTCRAFKVTRAIQFSKIGDTSNAPRVAGSGRGTCRSRWRKSNDFFEEGLFLQRRQYRCDRPKRQAHPAILA